MMKPIGKGREYENKNERKNNLRTICGQEVAGGEFLRVKNGISRFPVKPQVLLQKVKLQICR